MKTLRGVSKMVRSQQNSIAEIKGLTYVVSKYNNRPVLTIFEFPSLENSGDLQRERS